MCSTIVVPSVLYDLLHFLSIRCIFSEDRLFLRRLAYVMSRDGADSATYRPGFDGGIWQVGWVKEIKEIICLSVSLSLSLSVSVCLCLSLSVSVSLSLSLSLSLIMNGAKCPINIKSVASLNMGMPSLQSTNN